MLSCHLRRKPPINRKLKIKTKQKVLNLFSVPYKTTKQKEKQV